MTKETKIGLLVGLTFIVLFAIILSKKGPNNTRPPSTFTVADGGASDMSSRLTGFKPLDDAGKVAVEPMLPTPIRPERSDRGMVTMLEREVGQAIPAEGEPIPQLPDSIISRLNLPMIETPVAIEDDTGDSDPVGAADVTNSVVAALNGTSATEQSTAQTPNHTFARGAIPNANTGHEPGSQSNASNPATTSDSTALRTAGGLQDRPDAEPTAVRAAAPTKIIAVHEVQSGESLGKIAAKHYGRATPARIEAIYNANRDQLQSVDAVRANTKLNIPLLEGEYASMFEPAHSLAPAPLDRTATGRPNTSGSGTNMQRDTTVRVPVPVDERSSMVANSANAGMTPGPGRSNPGVARPPQPDRPSAPAVKFAWYEVREKDTLSKIAKSQLGSTKYYNEIYKLNTDIMPDQHKLKPGMKIRIPILDAPRSDSTMTTSSLAVGSATDD